MRISDIYKKNKTVVSFEIFPPKKDADIATVYGAIDALKCQKPDFISVTCGAGGSTSAGSVTSEVVRHIREKHGIEGLAHLTCSGAGFSAETVALELKLKGITNILALRGDDVTANSKYKYASELIKDLDGRGFCIGAAAYPEGHISSDNLDTDILNQKKKQDAGAEFFITQLFFDNASFYNYIEKARTAGLTVPVSAGIMPILSKAQISRMIFMCGASLPSPIIKIINKYGDEGESLVKAGLDYAVKQMQDLANNGADGIHIYTMNRPSIAEYAMKNLKLNRVQA